MKPITIYELKRRNLANGGKFFLRDTMKHWGDTLKGFKVSRDIDPAQVVVTRKRDGKTWRFNEATGRFLAPLSVPLGTVGNLCFPKGIKLGRIRHTRGA